MAVVDTLELRSQQVEVMIVLQSQQEQNLHVTPSLLTLTIVPFVFVRRVGIKYYLSK